MASYMGRDAGERAAQGPEGCWVDDRVCQPEGLCTYAAEMLEKGQLKGRRGVGQMAGHASQKDSALMRLGMLENLGASVHSDVSNRHLSQPSVNVLRPNTHQLSDQHTLNRFYFLSLFLSGMENTHVLELVCASHTQEHSLFYILVGLSMNFIWSLSVDLFPDLPILSFCIQSSNT